MEAVRNEATWRAEQDARDRAASRDRRQRAAEIQSAITQFLELMRVHGNPGAIALRLPQPGATRPPSLWQKLVGGAPEPAQTQGWRASETGAGPESAPVRLALTVDGKLHGVHQDFGGNGRLVWQLTGEFALGGDHTSDIDQRLEANLLSGLGRIVGEHGLTWPSG